MGFTKKDLKNGDIVTYRDGKKRIVINNELYESIEDICTNLCSNVLDNYTKKLLDKDNFRNVDIVKVERVGSYTTVFERKDILDEKEKEYLRTVIRPFKNEIKYIIKKESYVRGYREYIRIIFKDNDDMSFKDFKKGTMYKGMQTNKEYTLEELGL